MRSGLALELWFTLEASGNLPARSEALPTSCSPGGDARRLLASVEDRLLRERALGMLRERRADWVGSTATSSRARRIRASWT